MKNIESIPFLTDDNTEIEFYILEQTTINGNNYLLVSEDQMIRDDEDTVVYIMKEIPGESGDMVSYEIVEDEEELENVSRVFEQLMEDLDIEVE
ncbi:MAG: DUF1292 domain-containing protein [Eubacterium sp.]|nr:DUF1292 domain-containing protein [Eubacterium sp.]